MKSMCFVFLLSVCMVSACLSPRIITHSDEDKTVFQILEGESEEDEEEENALKGDSLNPKHSKEYKRDEREKGYEQKKKRGKD